jgi:hypothetical protein
MAEEYSHLSDLSRIMYGVPRITAKALALLAALREEIPSLGLGDLFMGRLLTGYAQGFNRRHRRRGHLFQNRYKSMVCQEDTYL